MFTRSSVRGLSLALLSAATLAGTSLTQAATFNFPGGYFSGGDTGLAGYDSSSIPTLPSLGNVYTGGDRLQEVNPTGPDLLAWCVDLSDSIYVGSTNIGFNVLADNNSTTVSYFGGLYSGANGAATIATLEHLASNGLGSVNNADSSAAFQLAVWDIAFDNGASTFAVANGADAAIVNADTARYLGNLSGAITERLTYLQDDSTNGGAIQHLATFAPVPLPASLPLLLSALAGLAAATGRRRALSTRFHS